MSKRQSLMLTRLLARFHTGWHHRKGRNALGGPWCRRHLQRIRASSACTAPCDTP